MNQGWKLKTGLLLALSFSSAYADDGTDKQIAQLQKMLEEQQKQMQAQQEQMKVMADQLRSLQQKPAAVAGQGSVPEEQQKAMQEQQWQINAMSDEVKALQDARGKSTGSPIYGSFKDGLIFEDGSGSWALQFNGRIQADYRSIDPDEWKDDTFSIRRARLGAQFTFLKDYVMRVEGEYSNTNDGSKGTSSMTYGYVEYKHFPGARVRVGQFKPVFGLERAESTNFTDFMELSMATSTGANFNSTYDRGITLFGAPVKGTYYNLSYVNGSGQNNDDMKDAKDWIGRAAGNIADWADWKNAVIHVGTSASRSSLQSSSAPNKTTLSEYSESNGITSNSASFTNTTATKFFSTTSLGDNVSKYRTGLETALAYGPVKFQGEYIDSNFDGNTNTGLKVDKDIYSWYASLAWMVTGENYADWYKDGMFGRMAPRQNFALGKDGFGAIELAVRYSDFDASDFQMITKAKANNGTGFTDNTSKTAQYTNKAHAWTAGAKWILNPNARLLLNYVQTRFDTPILLNGKSSDTEDAWMMRAQYDF
jgi:phosphate-selective porin OprO and OprP